MTNNGGCSDICNNNDGSFECKCSIGKTLMVNKKTCIGNIFKISYYLIQNNMIKKSNYFIDCPFGYYGENCANKCNCLNSVSCNAITGCDCLPGFNGTNCELASDLCQSNLVLFVIVYLVFINSLPK